MAVVDTLVDALEVRALGDAAVVVVRDISVHLKVRRAVEDLTEGFRILG